MAKCKALTGSAAKGLKTLVHNDEYDNAAEPGRSAVPMRWSSPSAEVRRNGLKTTHRYFPAEAPFLSPSK